MNAEFILQHDALVRLTGFALVLAAMLAWEALAPRRPARESRGRRWRTNLGVGVFNALLLRVALPTTAIGVAELAAARGWGLMNLLGSEGWLAVASAVVVLDLVLYLQHALFHRLPALMRLHAAHHADPDFDATTGVRFHPLEILISMLLKYAAIAALGAPALAVLLFELLLNVTSLFSHGNVGLPQSVDRALRCVLVTPDMHRIHHSTIRAERDSNYGFCLSVWDRLFGTYTAMPARGHEEMRIGLDAYPDARVSTTLSGMIAMPFRPS